MTENSAFNRICPFCGANNSRRLGECSVCHKFVCEKCGNVQFAHGERHVTHHGCLKKHDGGFRMIKFVE